MKVLPAPSSPTWDRRAVWMPNRAALGESVIDMIQTVPVP
jgi:hypothetical protein